ncbi:MAG: iron-containing alcohol dehydrogenase [Bacillota bacterium]
MQSFEYYSPTKIFFGKDAHSKIGATLRDLGAKKVLLHYGGGSAEKSGVLARVRASLEDAGVNHIELGGAKPNPELGLVKKGVRLCVDEGVDFLLAVGGGSAIDSAKAVALGLSDLSIDIWDYFEGKAAADCRVPVAAVLTIAAAGSETSNSCVITNEALGLKRGVRNESLRPLAAFLDPSTLSSLPAYQRGAGIVDIYMHTVERYFSRVPGGALTDRFGESVLKTTREFAQRFLNDPSDYEAASEIMWCSTMSHINLTGLGGVWDGAVHSLSQEISALYGATHGAALSAVWGAWAEQVLPGNPKRFLEYARRAWDIGGDGLSDEEIARLGIKRTVEFFASAGMPTSLEELVGHALSEEEIQKLTKMCSRGGAFVIGNMTKLGERDMYEIYSRAGKKR